MSPISLVLPVTRPSARQPQPVPLPLPSFESFVQVAAAPEFSAEWTPVLDGSTQPITNEETPNELETEQPTDGDSLPPQVKRKGKGRLPLWKFKRHDYL